MKNIYLLIFCVVCAQSIATTAFAGGSENFEFKSADQTIKLVYTRAANISIEVYAKGKPAYKTSFSEDNGPPEVEFVELNNDGIPDIIIRLEDESGFQPLILLSELGSQKYIKALADKTLQVDYTNLETDTPGKLHTAYKIVLNKTGEKTLVFHHLYIGRTLKHQVVLQLNDNKTDYIIQ